MRDHIKFLGWSLSWRAVGPRPPPETTQPSASMPPLRTAAADPSVPLPELRQVSGAQHVCHLRVSRQFQLTQGAQSGRRD